MQQNPPYEQHPESPNMHILVAGDSTGYGTGAATPRESIAGRIGTDFPQADITNIAIIGLRVAGLKEIIRTYFSQNPHAHFDLILFQIGGNDVTHFTNLSDVGADLGACIEEASLFTDHIVLMSTGKVGEAPVFHFPLTQILNMRTRKVRSVLLKESSKYPKVAYAEMYKEGEADLLNKDRARNYALDHFHPSSDGYGIWYQYLKPVISSLFL